MVPEHIHNRGRFPDTWFWRSHRKQEIDYLEEEGEATAGPVRLFRGLPWLPRGDGPPRESAGIPGQAVRFQHPSENLMEIRHQAP